MRLLVTGGAGYIGSVVAALLADGGHEVVVVDDLSTGHADAVPAAATFVQATIRDDDVRAVLADGIDAVLHFAAKSLVAESVAHPDRYWENNLGGTLALLEAMRVTGTRRIVFSSTASVYGEPERIPVTETEPVRPVNPYGASKAGRGHRPGRARPDARHRRGQPALLQRGRGRRRRRGHLHGERHDPETHLTPNVLATARDGGTLRLFGDDYPTPDGTCVRDYVHVSDLARAHVAALEAAEPGSHTVYNLGSGAGYSNLEVLDACREVTGLDIPAEVAPRRPGDPAVLVASSEAITRDLGWHAEHDLRSMVADAWTFTRQMAGAGRPRP